MNFRSWYLVDKILSWFFRSRSCYCFQNLSPYSNRILPFTRHPIFREFLIDQRGLELGQKNKICYKQKNWCRFLIWFSGENAWIAVVKNLRVDRWRINVWRHLNVESWLDDDRPNVIWPAERSLNMPFIPPYLREDRPF